MNTCFSVETIAFTIVGYNMSWIELFGTALNLWSVWLVAKRKILTWPVSIIAVLLFMSLFYQIRLYSDAIEQIYYLLTSIYGWWLWTSPAGSRELGVKFTFSSGRLIIFCILLTGVLSIGFGAGMSRVHIWFPHLFPAPADFPFLDALTTMMSFTANMLMAFGRIECWIYWITVDVIAVGLYSAKDVKLIAALYFIFLIIAMNGLMTWNKVRTRRQRQTEFA